MTASVVSRSDAIDAAFWSAERTTFPYRLLQTRRGVCRLGRGFEVHRSAHSTKAGGTSLRTIMTRSTRSSRRSVAVPRRAAATVAYRADDSANPDADPRLIVVISLNMCESPGS
jgi:hypothetical protein